jgi:hypothetical protein
MWEVKAHPEAMGDLLSWVCEKAVPAVEVEPLHVASEVFSSADGRIVVISRWRSNPVELADPPRHLVERKAHSWDLSPVDR